MQEIKTMAKKASVNVSEMLAAQAVSSKKKSEIPAEAPSRLFDEGAALKVAAQDAEAAWRVKEAEILEAVQAKYAALAEAGNFSKTIDCPGIKTPGLQVSFTDRFSAIPLAEAADLRAVDPEFSKHFEEKREISLRDTDDSTVERLIAKLGEKMFAEIFEVKMSVVAKAGMDERQFEVSPKIRAFLKQAKPSVKLLK